MGRTEELKTAKERRSKLYQRMREAKEIAQTTLDGAERRRQLDRARILHDMYVECGEEIARLEGRKLAETKHNISLDGLFEPGSLVWSDLDGMTWGSADGLTWADIQQARDGAKTGRQLKLLVDLMHDALRTCTERQRTYIHACYIADKQVVDIAQEYGVNKGTVSRVIKRGLAHVAHHVVARLTIARCLDDQGQFDYLKFARSTQLLTERQTELLYLALTQDASYRMMAAYLQRNVSTVSRTVDRAEARMASVRVEFLPDIDVSRIRFKDWSGIGERALAERLGLSRKFYYTTILRGQTIRGIPILHYHILCMVRSGWSEAETAAELGVSAALCRNVKRMYPDVPLALDLLPDYHPAQVRRNPAPGSVLAALRDLTRGTDAIIDRVDAATLQRVRRAVSC